MIAIAAGNRLSGVREALLAAAVAVERLRDLRSLMQRESDFDRVRASETYDAAVGGGQPYFN